MCIGVPGQIVAVGEDLHQLATVNICGVQRQIIIALVCDEDPAALLGAWVLVHVGFAMSIIDEQQARETLAALEQLDS